MEKVAIEFTKEEFDKIIEFMDGGEYETVQQAIMGAVEKKEQEAVAVQGVYCPKCGWILYPEDHQHYCGNCGQKVKWE